jgi:hypothetical protein
MKIKIRQHDASMPQEDGWSQTGDWLSELRDDNYAKRPGDCRAEPDGTDDPWPEILAQADVHAEAPREAAVMSAAVMTTCLETGPEQFATTPSPASAKPLTAIQRNPPRPLEVTQCSMCGIVLPLGLLVPDGGPACADIRWYCKDAMSCTERWTTARPPGRAQTPTASNDAFAGAGEAVPDRASQERLGSMFEAAQSAGLPTPSQVRRGSRGTHLRTPGHEGMRNAWISPIDIPRRSVCRDLGSASCRRAVVNVWCLEPPDPTGKARRSVAVHVDNLPELPGAVRADGRDVGRHTGDAAAAKSSR